MKNSILRSKILILQLALCLIFITMSKAKRPANMILLTASRQFSLNIAHIYPYVAMATIAFQDGA